MQILKFAFSFSQKIPNYIEVRYGRQLILSKVRTSNSIVGLGTDVRLSTSSLLSSLTLKLLFFLPVN